MPWKRDKNGHFSRAQAMLMSRMKLAGRDIPEIAKIAGCSPVSVRDLIKANPIKRWTHQNGKRKAKEPEVQAEVNTKGKTPRVVLRKVHVEHTPSAAVNEAQYLQTTRELLLHPGWLDRFLKEVKEAAS